MKKVVLIFTAGLFAVAFAAGIAMSNGEENGANVVGSCFCKISPPLGYMASMLGETGVSKIVYTPSGNINGVCQVKFDFDLCLKRALVFNKVCCWVKDGCRYKVGEGQIVVTPAGTATLTCHVKECKNDD